MISYISQFYFACHLARSLLRDTGCEEPVNSPSSSVHYQLSTVPCQPLLSLQIICIPSFENDFFKLNVVFVRLRGCCPQHRDGPFADHGKLMITSIYHTCTFIYTDTDQIWMSLHSGFQAFQPF